MRSLSLPGIHETLYLWQTWKNTPKWGPFMGNQYQPNLCWLQAIRVIAEMFSSLIKVEKAVKAEYCLILLGKTSNTRTAYCPPTPELPAGKFTPPCRHYPHLILKKRTTPTNMNYPHLKWQKVPTPTRTFLRPVNFSQNDFCVFWLLFFQKIKADILLFCHLLSKKSSITKEIGFTNWKIARRRRIFL